MVILGIETSCDETAIALIEYKKRFFRRPTIKILANELISQIKVHEQYGGVFPMMAKREHGLNLVPLLLKILESINLSLPKTSRPEPTELYCSLLQKTAIEFGKDTILFEQIKNNLSKLVKPKKIDAIAVTNGPGLEPCLWTGLNFAKSLGAIWNLPVIPINHMEGHILVSLLRNQDEIQDSRFKIREREKLPTTRYKLQNINFPAIALLISGGHTELVMMKDWGKYEIVGQTKDDAVGEAFDKVARTLGLPYPGGPQISAMAEIARTNAEQTKDDEKNFSQSSASVPRKSAFSLPRPMLKSPDLNFSFSGLKTAVLYLAKRLGELSETQKQQIAREFEDAVVEVLTIKTAKAIERFGARSLILGGGVIANKEIRKAFEKLAQDKSLKLFLPQLDHATDNAIMISVAGALNITRSGLVNKAGPCNSAPISAQGNLKLS